MTDNVEAIFVVAALAISFIGMAAATFVVQREQRRMLRELRKLAALYPPYPVADDEDAPGRSSVVINEQWRDDQPGRD